MRSLLAAVAAACAFAPGAFANPGTFVSSDTQLNQIWAASVQTADDMVVPGPLTTSAFGTPCVISTATALIDGVVRDRCPYTGDQAVTGMTLLVSTTSADSTLHDMIEWYAANQNPDGSFPASPIQSNGIELFDYNAFWIEDLYDYVLYTGDLSLARQVLPNLQKLIGVWYPAQAGPSGLLVDQGLNNYALIMRGGSTVAYYNAGYVRALRMAAQIATWIGDPSDASNWLGRITPVASAFTNAFWDPTVAAFKDATDGPVVHPQDGNAFAVLAGLATKPQAVAALNYLSNCCAEPWGNTIADNNTWDTAQLGTDVGERVYPFMSYFEVLARYAAGLDDSALALIKREWGYMLKNGPGTMWEMMTPFGGPPGTQGGLPGSWDHGWSSGAAPALTNYVLGVQPTSPGFATFTVTPHPSNLASAHGSVPTPGGNIAVSWTQANGKLSLTVSAPPGETWTNPPTVVKAVTKATPKAKPKAEPKAKPKAKKKISLHH